MAEVVQRVKNPDNIDAVFDAQFDKLLYYVIMGVALWLRLPTNDLKLFTAAIVALALALPHLRQKGYGSARRSEKKEAGSHG